MNLSAFIFYFFLLTAATSAIGILFSKNVFKAALLLLLCLLCVAALYVMAFAEFVAITQILIYAGGLVIVIIFGIMITTNLTGKPLQVSHSNLFSGILVGCLVLGLLINLIAGLETAPATSAGVPATSLEIIGVNLITKFALPFELTGVLLLVSLIGAAVVASFMKSKKI
jgi:NADH:ubiquinone oxidoreductase subunit 6 (subunit J)